jgi:Ca2+/Na+ antiporter
MENVDFYMNLAALIIYIIFLIILMIKRKGRIDHSAKIICIGYPLGIVA